MTAFPPELNLFRRKRLPVIVGAEAAECGLVALTMIARYYGHDVDLNSLRQRFSLSIAGASLRALIDLSDQLGFSTRALRVELEGLSKVSTPAILHWDLSHFVVLAKADERGIVIHDPATGRHELSYKEASNHFTGVVLELQPAAHFKKIEDRTPTPIHSLWADMRGFWRSAIQILALSVALQIVVFVMPFQIQLVVDEAIGRADASLLPVIALGFAAVVLLHAVIEALRAYSLQVFGQLMKFQMIGNLVRHLLRLKADYYEKRHIGDILSRIQSTGPLQDALTQNAPAILIDGLMSIAAFSILLFYSVKLALVVLAGLTLTLVVTFAFFPIVRRRSEEQIIARAKEQSHLMQSLRAAKTLKVFGREAERENAWRNLFAEAVNASFSLGKFQIAQTFAQTLITGLQVVLIIYLAADLILSEQGFSVGMLFAFLSFRQTLTDRALALINQGFQLRLLGLHLDRIGDIVHADLDLDVLEAVPDREIDGRIELEGVSFRYGSSDALVLKDVNLTIAPGEFIAITGPSGGGKTTLLKLLLGLYPPTTGQIRLDGNAASSGLWHNWRSRVGLVAQDDHLLSGTLADNISFFDPDMDMERVIAAAVTACVHDEIGRMPMQYHSLVGDMGSTLSGGQRQRVLLARALYRNPKILMLDEGTANLDRAAEANIANLVRGLGVTRIIIAHRPALIEKADRVLRVADGTVTIDKSPGQTA